MKNFFIYLFVCAFFISCTNNKKPNIIWITIEDQSQYLLPFNGNTDVSLPNLEKIADESIIFDNMYATYPVCAPARSSIITGITEVGKLCPIPSIINFSEFCTCSEIANP